MVADSRERTARATSRRRGVQADRADEHATGTSAAAAGHRASHPDIRGQASAADPRRVQPARAGRRDRARRRADVAAFQSAWWAVVPASVIAFLVVHRILTTLGPLDAHPRVHTRRGSSSPRWRCCRRHPWDCWSSPARSSRPGDGSSSAEGLGAAGVRLRSPLPWVMAAHVHRGRRRLPRDAAGVVRRRDRPDRLGADHRRQPRSVG